MSALKFGPLSAQAEAHRSKTPSPLRGERVGVRCGFSGHLLATPNCRDWFKTRPYQGRLAASFSKRGQAPGRSCSRRRRPATATGM
jgi:hypothetical protein